MKILNEETLVKIVLTKIYISDEKKDGTKFIDKNGKPFKRVAIQTDSHGETWLSSFSFRDSDEMREWKEGQEVQILISKRDDFWNFRIPTKADLLEERVTKLEEAVFDSKDTSTGSIDSLVDGTPPDYPF
jgi:hypothetical protein